MLQPPYNSLVVHNSPVHDFTHICMESLTRCRQILDILAQFRARLNSVKFTGCQFII